MQGTETEAPLLGVADGGTEALACVYCRSRKLKCDRLKPVCTRCTKSKTPCEYPESRRKPTARRANVKQIEARLAQVEGLLQQTNVPADDPEEVNLRQNARLTGSINDLSDLLGAHANVQTQPPKRRILEGHVAGAADGPGFAVPPSSSQELIDLGLSEALPPLGMIEDLNREFFRSQYPYIPIIHEARFLESFYSAPHKRPPMCLLYAVWALAAKDSEKYRPHHEIFYRRARQYAYSDEMDGLAEFITVAHAQAWALIATYEAKNLIFSRAALSSARCVRLVEMMNLHCIDTDEDEGVLPSLTPASSWIEVEERRRTFWTAFCIDSHASTSTGWPSLIDHSQIATRLPSSEEAFASGIVDEQACFLEDVFDGGSFSDFGGTIVCCHIFNMILKHVYRPKKDEKPDDVKYGRWWQQHTKLDNILSSTFMFLPERFRMPENVRNPAAVNTNLNLHAAIICLHSAAMEMVDKYQLPDSIKESSLIRMRTAAEEIIKIFRLTSNIPVGPRNNMTALSMYTSVIVYIYQAKSIYPAPLPPTDQENLTFVLRAMEAISRTHLITRSFLHQLWREVESTDLRNSIRLPNLSRYENIELVGCSVGVPLLLQRTLLFRDHPFSGQGPPTCTWSAGFGTVNTGKRKRDGWDNMPSNPQPTISHVSSVNTPLQAQEDGNTFVHRPTPRSDSQPQSHSTSPSTQTLSLLGSKPSNTPPTAVALNPGFEGGNTSNMMSAAGPMNTDISNLGVGMGMVAEEWDLDILGHAPFELGTWGDLTTKWD